MLRNRSVGIAMERAKALNGVGARVVEGCGDVAAHAPAVGGREGATATELPASSTTLARDTKRAEY